MPPGKSVFIANGNSYLARYFAKSLVLQGNQVYLSASQSPLFLAKVATLLKDPNFNLFNSEKAKDFLKKPPKIDSVFYFPSTFLNLENEDFLEISLVLDFCFKNKIPFFFISNLSVFQGMVSASSIENYFGFKEDEQHKFSQIENLRYLEATIWKYQKEKDPLCTIIRLGDVYGPGMDFLQKTEIEKIIKNFIEEKPLKILGSGLRKHYLIYLEDAVSFLQKCVDSINLTVSKIVSVANPSPVAEIEFSYLLNSFLKNKEQSQIIFSKETEETQFGDLPDLNLKNNALLSFAPKYSLKEGIKQTLESFNFFSKDKKEETKEEASETPEPVKSVPKLPIKFKRPKFKYIFFFGLMPVLFFAVFPVAIFSFFFIKGSYLLNRSYTYLENGKNSNAETSLKMARSAYLESSSVFPGIFLLPAVIGAKENRIVLDFTNLATAYSYYCSVLQSSLDGFMALQNPSDQLASINYYFSNSRHNLGFAEDRILQVKSNFLKANFGYFKNNKVGDFSKINFLENLNYQDILGFNDKRKYLVLFVDNLELRPTGGVVKAYSEVSVEKGKYSLPEFFDVATQDNTLSKGDIFIPAPDPIKELLKKDRLLIKDSLWEKDFSESSTKILDLFFEATGNKYNGVIALDLDTLSLISKIYGEIELTNGNKVNSSNIIDWYKNLEASSANLPNDLVIELLNKYSLQVLNKKISFAEFNLFANLLSKKHLQFYFRNGFNLDVYSTPFCLNNSKCDALGVLDANLGETKTNQEIKRLVVLSVEEQEEIEGIKNTLEITWEHLGKSNSWPSGPYKNFVSIMVPNGSNLLEAYLGKGTSEDKMDIRNGIITKNSGLFTVYGTYLEIRAKEKATIKISYLLPRALLKEFKEKSTYSIFLISQAGISKEDLNIKVNFNGKKANFVENIQEDKVVNLPLK